MQTIDREVPANLDVHVVLDNSSTHKTPAVKKWLLAHLIALDLAAGQLMKRVTAGSYSPRKNMCRCK